MPFGINKVNLFWTLSLLFSTQFRKWQHFTLYNKLEDCFESQICRIFYTFSLGKDSTLMIWTEIKLSAQYYWHLNFMQEILYDPTMKIRAFLKKKKKIRTLSLNVYRLSTDFPNLIKCNVFLLWCINISHHTFNACWSLLKIKLNVSRSPSLSSRAAQLPHDIFLEVIEI